MYRIKLYTNRDLIPNINYLQDYLILRFILITFSNHNKNEKQKYF